MKTKYRSNKRILVSGLMMLFAISSLSARTMGPPVAKQTAPQTTTGTNLSPHERQLVDKFNRHVKDYLKQREMVRKKVAPLSKDSTPEQIDAYQRSFIEALRAMRVGTKQGYIFTPEFTEYVRNLIRTEFQPEDRAEIKQTIMEADTKGVPLKVNYPYPEQKERATIPPTLLLKLPQLPKEVKYRFVGRHLLLVDTDNNLIVDYTVNALP